MSTRRIVVQHPDMRRLTVDEADFDNPDANPLNREHDSHEWDSDHNTTVLVHYPAKPVDDWKSLKQMGFVPYAYIHGPKCDRSCKDMRSGWSSSVSVHGERHQAKTGLLGYCRCVLLSDEEAEMLELAADTNRGDPSSIRDPMNAPVLGCAATVARLVLQLLGSYDEPQIAATVVEAVPIDVIDLHRVTKFQAHQETVELDLGRVLSLTRARQTIRRVPTRSNVPTVLADAISVSSVHERIGTDRPVFPVQRNLRHPIHDDERDAVALLDAATLASLRAVPSPLDCRVVNVECRPAHGAGKIDAHREASLPGVTPPAATSSAGVSCRCDPVTG
jgi:hypothetical protein